MTDTYAARPDLGQELARERWAPIPGYEGAYEASDAGRIRSLRGGRRKPRILRASADSRRGYLKVNLCLDNVIRTHKVHRLVALTFLGLSDLHVLHWNDDPADNRLENLRYGTNSENVLDSVRNGTHAGTKRTHCPRGHEYTPENTIRSGRKRQCRECKRAWDRAHWPERSQKRRSA